MKPFAYKTTSLAIKAISNLSRANINLHGKENIPESNTIFAINHFTRIETFLMPYIISKLTDKPVWSLADYTLFEGAFGKFLETVGAVSNKIPDRDKLIIKTLLTGEASWIIFPEGQMIKDKKLIEKRKFMVYNAGGRRPPHTGAATLAMRAEFYRRRIITLCMKGCDEAKRLIEMFQIDSIDKISPKETNIVPVNISYYPVRTKVNVLSKLAGSMVDNIPERVIEEIMTEGTMLLEGVDIDIRFGKPISLKERLAHDIIKKDLIDTESFDFDDPIPSRRKMRKEAIKLMQEYMGTIYNMTTINYDHLFALLLKKTWYRNLDNDFLKRKVFLIISDLQSKPGLFLHSDLTAEQTHLLTDDRHSKYKNFIQMAVETGIIEKTDNRLFLNKPGFFTKSDFHRIRIENPVAVLANCTEPLKKLQSTVSKYALMPDYFVRKKLAGLIIKKELDDFEADYQTNYLPRGSKPERIGSPYLLNKKGSNTGVLLIHGYMAAPEEVRSLAKYINALGFRIYATRLKGHGTAPEDLAVRSYDDWITSVERGYAILSNMCDHVIIGGFSTGAGLALELVSRVPGIRGVFAVNPPMKLQDFSARFVPAVDVWNSMMKKMKIKSMAKEFVENNPEHPHINYTRNPISGIRQLERLMEKVKDKLEDIKIPALIVQGSQDPVVNPEGSKQIFERLGSEDKTYELLDFDRHGIIMDEGSEKVHRVIGEFLKRVLH
ncbi:MAG: alpha/beta fold hydrolase [Desulfobacteraceae bacterium]|jgi:esterase/lipase/1-acyl-sn-glycerol-3-phosphate acyltransferase